MQNRPANPVSAIISEQGPLVQHSVDWLENLLKSNPAMHHPGITNNTLVV